VGGGKQQEEERDLDVAAAAAAAVLSTRLRLGDQQAEKWGMKTVLAIMNV